MSRSSAPANSPQAKTSAGGRAWLFRLVLLLGAPLVFFFGLEGTLRVGGYGRNPHFFIPDDSAPGYHRTNPRFTELFFPASFGLKPANFRLSREKPADDVTRLRKSFLHASSAAETAPLRDGLLVTRFATPDSRDYELLKARRDALIAAPELW